MKRSPEGSIFQRKGRTGWYARLRRGGKNIKRRGGETPADAYAVLATLKAEAAERPRRSVPFSEFAAIYAALREAKGQATEGKYVPRFVAFFGDRDTASIRRADIIRYLDTRLAVKPATRMRELAALGGLFSAAVERGYAETNPTRGIKRERLEERAVPALTRDEQARLLAGAPGRLRDLAVVAVETGLRLGELARLEWGDVSGSRLTVRKSKSGKPRVVPLTARARAVLDERRAARVVSLDGPGRVFAEFPAEGDALDGTPRKLWRRAMRALGHEGFRFHDLRHLFGVNAARAGVPMTTLQRIMGHSSLTMTMRYASHIAECDLDDAAARLDGEKGNHLGNHAV